MACILRPECNFLNGYFRCLLPLETVDIEVKIKMMRGIHTFRRDRTTQFIKCNPWSKRSVLIPLIQKMKTYLELEDKLSPKPRLQPQTQPLLSTSAPSQSNTNFVTRKPLGPNMSEQKKTRTKVPTRRRYKVRVIAQPIPTTPMPATPVNSTPTVPTSTVATTSTQMPLVKSAATSILVMVYNLVKGKFDEVPYPTERPQENPFVHNSNPPPLEAIPNVPVREATPWPSTE